MEKFENTIKNPLEKDNKLEAIPEDFDKLSVEEAFKYKHIVFEAQECFDKTKINLFDNFTSSYAKAYETDSVKLAEVKQTMQDNIYAIRFDPKFFLLIAQDKNSLAGYLEEYKTLMLPDMKTYKNPEVYTHELVHAIGCIYRNADFSKIEDYEIYNEFNEGITEKMTVEMMGKRKEAYSPQVKCVQIIDEISGGKVNDAFQKYDVDSIKELYDQKVAEGSLEDLIFNMHGVENTFKELRKYSYEVEDYEEKEDVNSAEFRQKYNTIKKIFSEEDEMRLSGDKEKYLRQTDKTDEELKKFENEIVDYVIAKEYVLKYDKAKKINLICKRMANTVDKHLGTLITKSDTLEEQKDVMQKFCNMEAMFNFSENKIEVLEEVIAKNKVKLYEKMTNRQSAENSNIYEKLGIKHNLKWLTNQG